MPKSSNNKRPRNKSPLRFLPKLLLLSFLSFVSAENSDVKNSGGSIKKRCVFMDDGFELKDCGNAPTQSEFADFLKKQAEEVARLAKEFPCGYTSCPRFKRDLEFIYKSIEKHEDEVRPKSNSGDVGDRNLDDKHITKGILEDTHKKPNDQNSGASDLSMKAIDERKLIKPSESLILMAGPKTLQITISPETPIYRAPEEFQKSNSKLVEEDLKTTEPKVNKYEEKVEKKKEKSKTQNLDYLWREEKLEPEFLKKLVTPDSSQIDQEMSKHSITSDPYTPSPRTYNLPEPVSVRAYDRVPDDFEQISSISNNNVVQDLEPRFDLYDSIS